MGAQPGRQRLRRWDPDRIGPYVARYLPRTWLAVLTPAAFLAVIFPLNWVAGLILLCATPVIPSTWR